MVRKLLIPNPCLDKNEVTLLTAFAAAGATTLEVQSSEHFAVNDFILLGLPGCDTTEVAQIATIPDKTSVTLVAGTCFDHDIDAAMIKLDYDQICIYRSTDTGATYSLLATIQINYANHENVTEYIDATGQQSYYYKWTHKNSFSGTETEQNGPITQEQMIGYITPEEFCAQTGISVHTDLVREAIAWGAMQIRRELYAVREYRTGSPKDEHFLPVHPRFTFADADLDARPINKNDFYAYEQDQSVDGLPGAITDVTSDITGVDIERMTVSFSIDRPTATDKQLVIVWHETWEKLKFDNLPESIAGIKRWFNIDLKRLNKLWAVNYVFENVPFHTLQRGISSWSLGGVNIPFDYDVMQRVMEDNRKRIDHIIQKIETPYVRNTTFRDRPFGNANRRFLSTLRRADGTFFWQ